MDGTPLEQALMNKLQVTITYTKEKTGEVKIHTGGITKIGVNKAGKPALWLWDTSLQDNIRQMLLSNINSFQVLDTPFVVPNGWPLELNGQIIGY
jgi:hypothetical protein